MDSRWIQRSNVSAVTESPRNVERAVRELLEICFKDKNRTTVCLLKRLCNEGATRQGVILLVTVITVLFKFNTMIHRFEVKY